MKFGDVPPPVASFELPPVEALKFLKNKGLKPTFSYLDMAESEHERAFTVAKMMDVDLLADVRASLDKAMAEGIPFETWAKEITPMLQARGWWGKKLVVDPVSGTIKNVQLGSAARLETIFRTNLQSAYAAGHWDEIQANKEEAPYLMYDAIDDYRTRDAHRAWDGTVLPVDHPWWQGHYPPCGWNCRCGSIQLSEDELDALGLKPTEPAPSTATEPWENPRTGETMKVPVGVDPGFGKPPSAPSKQTPKELLTEKVQSLPQDLAASANLGVEAMNKQIAREVSSRVAKQAAAAELAAAELGIAESEAAALVAEQAAANAAAEAAAAALEAEKLAELEAAAAAAELKAQKAAKKAAEKAAAKKVTELGQAAPNTLVGKAYQSLLKAGALDGDQVAALEKLESAIEGAKAAHQKGTLLGGYKAKVIAGKLPTEAQQAAFASLSAAEQEALLVEAQKAKDKLAALAAAEAAAAEKAAAEAAAAQAAAEAAAAAEKAAQEALAAKLLAEAAAAEAAALAEAEAAAKALADAKAAEEAAAAKAIADKKAAAAAKSAATKAKKKAAKEAAAQAAAEVKELPPAALKTSATEPMDGSTFIQVGPQKGSNPGGSFKDTTTGQEWYVKFPLSPEIARNEGLTANLYELAGVEAPEYRFIDMPDGRRGIASKWIPDLEIDQRALIGGVDGVADGFGADAWLANWDVVGQNYDNLKVQGGIRARRVDTGGGLLYRAQGQPKGAAFGDEVLELSSLRDARLNPQAASVFGSLTEAQIETSVAKVLRVSDADIARVVDAWGPVDKLERDALKRRLIARKQYLWEKYPKARPDAVKAPPAPLPDAGARVTAVEQKFIEEARLNGYAIRTDKGQIEDQDVLVAIMADKDGPLTRGHLKLTASGDELLAAKIKASLGGVETTVYADHSDLDEPILALIKGINSRAAKGGALDQVNIDRWNALKPRLRAARESYTKKFEAFYDKLKEKLGDDAVFDDPRYLAAERVSAQIGGWEYKLERVMEGKSAADAAVAVDGTFEVGKLKWAETVKRDPTSSGPVWRKERDLYIQRAQTVAGRATLTDERVYVPGVETVYYTEVDGVRVRYITFEGNDRARALQGILELDAPGAGTSPTGRVFEAMEKLGLRSERADVLDRKELYLNKIARINTTTSVTETARYAKLDDIADQAARIEAKTKHISALVGRDITAADDWGSWEGTYQAYGHGRPYSFRSDLDEAEFNKFAKNHVLYHNPTGLGLTASRDMLDTMKIILDNGGQLVSIADRTRRGLPMPKTSPEDDIRKGGATQVFLRILKVDPKNRAPRAGLYWKPRQLKRTDALSYENDLFGNSQPDVMRANRKSTIEHWREIAADGGYRNASNETSFKNTMSFFDDLEQVVLPSKEDVAELIRYMKEKGYSTWPDGRKLTDVIIAQ